MQAKYAMRKMIKETIPFHIVKIFFKIAKFEKKFSKFHSQRIYFSAALNSILLISFDKNKQQILQICVIYISE